jgi:hypothetical protein
MASTRLRYTMLGFILGVVFLYVTAKVTAISEGVRYAAPFYGAGIGILIDNFIMRRKQRKSNDE